MPSKSKKKRQASQPTKSTTSSTNTSIGSTVTSANSSLSTSTSNGILTEKTVIDPSMLKALARNRSNGIGNNSISSNGSSITSKYGIENDNEHSHNHEYDEQHDEEEDEDEDEDYSNDDPLLSKTSIQRLLSDTRNVPAFDVPDDENLRPRSTLTHPTLPLSRNAYLLKQNDIFKQLTGHQSWRSKRESDLNTESNDKLLMKMLEIFIAGQDELIYNEYSEQKYLLDIVEDAAESAARYVLSNQSSNMKLRSLVINYGKMKAQVGKLHAEFLESSAARSAVERQREHLQSALTDEFTKRIRLEHVCKGMKDVIKKLEIDLKKEKEQNKQYLNPKEELQRQSQQNQQQQQQLPLPQQTIYENQISSLVKQLEEEKKQSESQRSQFLEAAEQLKDIREGFQDLTNLKDSMREEFKKQISVLTDGLKRREEDFNQLQEVHEGMVQKYDKMVNEIIKEKEEKEENWVRELNSIKEEIRIVQSEPIFKHKEKTRELMKEFEKIREIDWESKLEDTKRLEKLQAELIRRAKGGEGEVQSESQPQPQSQSQSQQLSSQLTSQPPSKNTLNTLPPPNTALPELLDIFLKSSSPSKDKAKLLLRQFFEQYAAREKFYKSTIRDKDMQIQIYLTRAKQERSIAETERKRAQILKDQVAASSIALSNVTSTLDTYKDKYSDKYIELDKIMNSSHDLIEESLEKMDNVEDSVSNVRSEHNRVLDILSKIVQSVEKAITIAEERDSLKSKVTTLENLCRTLATNKSKIQADLAIQTALVKEMRTQDNDFEEDDDDDDYDDDNYEDDGYFETEEDELEHSSDYDHNHDDDDFNSDHNPSLLPQYLLNNFPNEKSRKASEHKELLIIVNKVKDWKISPSPPNSSSPSNDKSLFEMFGFKTVNELKKFVNSPSGKSGNCGDECPIHSDSSPYKHLWEDILKELRRVYYDSNPLPPKKTKPIFGPVRPPNLQKSTTNGST